MTGPLDDNLLQQALGTLIPLCVGAAVLTGIYQLSLWIVRYLRRRWFDRQRDHQHIRSA